MSTSPARAGLLLRAAAIVATVALVADAVAAVHGPSGVSTFGRPPELAVLWAAGGGFVVVLMGRARDRLVLARLATLALTVASLFGMQGVAADPTLHLVLAGVTLLVARPFLRRSAGAVAAILALLLAVPALLTTSYPHGVALWLPSILPYVTLPVLLPSLFSGAAARQPATVIVAATALLGAAALATYPVLSAGLALPLDTVMSTRLRLLGMHPNLAVPQLVTSLVLGAALAWDDDRRTRGWALAAVAVIAAALAALQSRTGVLTAVFGVGLLVAGRLPWRVARLVHPLGVLAVVGALLLPVTGLSDPTITRPSDAMVSKAASFRSAHWELGRDTWLAAPFTGNGPRTTHLQAVQARPGRYDGMPKDDHPHNVFLLVGQSLGWPGLAGLTVLLVTGLRRPFGRGTLLVDAAGVATVVLWTANGIDLGGTALTLYPSLAFLYLGLGDAAAGRATGGGDAAAVPGEAPGAHARETTPGARDQASPPLGRTTQVVMAVVALVAIGWSISRWYGLQLLRDADARLAASAERSDDERAEVAALLERADGWLPEHPAVPSLRARLAGEAGDVDARLAHLEQARARFPDSASLARALALVLARRNVSDRRVEELLDEALRLDPYGPEAWGAHTDRALVAAHRADATGALRELLAAALLNPAAVTQPGITWVPATGTLRLSADGRSGVDLALQDLFDEIDRRRAELASVDPKSETRLRMREVEILINLGDYARAEELTARQLVDPRYLGKQLARSALRKGDIDGAVAAYAEHGPYVDFELLVEQLQAHAEQEPLDEAACNELLARIEASMPDPLFELGSLKRLLSVRHRLAERTLDSEAAATYADALQFAER